VSVDLPWNSGESKILFFIFLKKENLSNQNVSLLIVGFTLRDKANFDRLIFPL